VLTETLDAPGSFPGHFSGSFPTRSPKRFPNRSRRRSRGRSHINSGGDGQTAVTRTYLFDPSGGHTGYAKPIEEWVDDGQGAALDRTYTIGHRIIAQFDTANGTLLFLQDAHGSTRALADDAGLVIQRFAYEAFGDTLAGSGLTLAAAAFTAWLRPDGAYDANTAFTYHLERWRSGHVFLTFDPFNTTDPIALHKYLYAHANPAMGTDPTGLMSLVELLVGQTISIKLLVKQLFMIVVGQAFFHKTLANLVQRDNVFGVGGMDVTAQLHVIRTQYRATWNATPPISKYLIVSAWHHPSTFIDAWDIYQMANKKSSFTVGNPRGSVPDSVTVLGAVYPAEEVNYFLWGVINRLAWEDNLGMLYSWAAVESAIRTYRTAYSLGLHGSGHIGSRVAWAQAGWDAAASPGNAVIVPPTRWAYPRATANPVPYNHILDVYVGVRAGSPINLIHIQV
jgi:hypothetical protein